MFEHQVFHVHCKYLKAHQEIVSNLIYTETLKSALSRDTKPITKVFLHCFKVFHETVAHIIYQTEVKEAFLPIYISH